MEIGGTFRDIVATDRKHYGQKTDPYRTGRFQTKNSLSRRHIFKGKTAINRQLTRDRGDSRNE
jgi:hypothetical protein